MSTTKISNRIHEHAIYNKAIFHTIYSQHQKYAIEEKIQNLEDDYIQEYNRLPPNRKAIRSKIVFQVKYHSNALIVCYKTRLMTQGFLQIHKTDFNKRFSSIVRQVSLEIFLVISCLRRFIIKQVDIFRSYLKSLLGNNNLPIFNKTIYRNRKISINQNKASILAAEMYLWI